MSEHSRVLWEDLISNFGNVTCSHVPLGKLFHLSTSVSSSSTGAQSHLPLGTTGSVKVGSLGLSNGFLIFSDTGQGTLWGRGL